ncbi:MAG: DNA recombination protein RmuC [Alphaproteobacteria bacterium]|nr:DNA recombination protein RmuC [Alphaproteobacteria bacterium]
MTTYILIALGIIIGLLLVLLFRKPPAAADLSPQINRLRDVISERLGALAQNANDLKAISGDIANFKNILMGNKQARGQFGERQLEDLVTDVMPPETYEFQCSFDNGTRPDCVIKLPYPPGDMAIDSKFPFENYAKMQSAETETDREMSRKQFEIAVRTHIDAIASKYIISGKTAESAMMFIGAESIFEALHREFPGLVDYAARRRVFIVSPATLWATLNTVRSVLSDIKIKRVAGQIKKELELLLTDLSRLSDRAAKMATHFRQTTDDLEQLQTSINKITPRAEKLRELEFGE